MNWKKEIKYLSIDELVEESKLTAGEGRSYPIVKLFSHLYKKSNNFTSLLHNDDILLNRLFNNFQFIFIENNKIAIELLGKITDENLKDDLILNIFESDKIKVIKAINLLNFITNKRLKDDLILNNFDLILNVNRHKAFKILKLIENRELRDDLILNNFDKLLKHNEIKVFKILELVVDKNIKSRLIKSIDNKIEDLIEKIKTIQYTQNLKIKKVVLIESNNLIALEKEERLNIKFDIRFLFKLLKKEKNLIQYKEIIKWLKVKLLLNQFKDNFSELIYHGITQSEILHQDIYELERFITTPYFQNQLKKFKQQQESKKNANKILNQVSNNRKKKKKPYFIELFKQKHKIKTIHSIIPEVAKKDFKLAKELMNEVQKNYLVANIRREIFLELYKKDFLKAIECYCKLNDFHTKVELSREVIDYNIPKFKKSFFAQTMSILDSQNIVNTPMDLATIAPHEVLKYYGEIEDDIEDRVDGVIEKIEELKSKREEARSLKDRELLRGVGVEIQKLKDEIQKDNELFEAFLTRFNIDEFEFEDRLLLDLSYLKR